MFCTHPLEDKTDTRPRAHRNLFYTPIKRENISPLNAVMNILNTIQLPPDIVAGNGIKIRKFLS